MDRRIFISVIFVCYLLAIAKSAGICEQAEKYINDTKTLLDQALISDRLNLLLLLDISGSIGKTLFHTEVGAFAIELINYGIHHQGMKLHPDHAHLEVVTFHDTAQVKLYDEESRSLHACEIHEVFQRILDQNSFTGRTQVHVAFNVSSHVFLKNQRVSDKKVLVLVTDGGFTSYPDEIHTSVGMLGSLGVEIFTVGVGSLQSDWLEDNIMNVIRDDLHFLCYPAWKSLLKTDKDTDKNPITWADVTADQMTSRCPDCDDNSGCQCAVNLQQYQCRCDAGFYRNLTGSCDRCPTSCQEEDTTCVTECTDVEHEPSTEAGVGGSLSMTLVIALAVVGGAILLGGILLLCLLLLRKRAAEPAENNTTTGRFNFIILSKVINIKNIFTSKRAARAPNPYVMDPSRPPSLDVRDFRPVNDIVRQLEENIKGSSADMPQNRNMRSISCTGNTHQHEYASVDPPVDPEVDINRYEAPRPRMDADGYQRPMSHGYAVLPVPSTRSSTYENITHRADQWNSYINRLTDITPLASIALFCKEDESITSTENFHIRLSDMAHAQRLLGIETQLQLANGGQNQQRPFLPINGRIFEVHHFRNQTENSLYAEEITSCGEKAVAWLIGTDRHIVFGIGSKCEAILCQKALSELCSELGQNDSPPNQQ